MYRNRAFQKYIVQLYINYQLGFVIGGSMPNRAWIVSRTILFQPDLSEDCPPDEMGNTLVATGGFYGKKESAHINSEKEGRY